MSGQVIEKRYVLVPTTVYGGNIHIKKRDLLTKFQKLVLRYIARNNNLSEVLNGFGLNPRIMNEIIVSLLYNDLIILDLNSNYIDVTKEIAQRIQDESLDEFFKESQAKKLYVEWVQERITGNIISEHLVKDYFKSEKSIDSSEIIDLRDRGIEKVIPLQEYSSTILVKAVKFFLKSKELDEDTQLLDQIERVSDITLTKNRPLYLPIQKRYEDGKSLYFLNTPDLPDTFIDSMTNKLNNEIIDFSSDYLEPVFDPIVDYTINGFIKHWQMLTNKFFAINKKGMTKNRQIKIIKEILDKLTTDSATYLGILKTHIKSVNNIKSYIFRGQQILDDLRKACDKAEKTIIIGSAFCNIQTIKSLTEIFQNAINRDINIILVWGLAEIEDPEDLTTKIQEIESYLDETFNYSRLNFLLSKRPFHSKFLLIDGKEAWITSCNLLNKSFMNETKEAITWINGGEIPIKICEYALENIEKTSHVIVDLEENLTTLREGLPDSLDKERQDLLKFVDESYQDLLTALENFIIDYSETNKELIISSIKKWNNLLKKVKKLASGILIENLEHRRLLLSCLRNANSTINIASDRIRKEAITPPLRKHLREALRRKVKILIIWGREMTVSSIKENELREILSTIDSIERDTENELKIKKNPSGVHAKILTYDSSSTLLTSYNLLAFGGTRKRDSSISGELGIVVNSKKEAEYWKKFFENNFP